MCRISFRVVVIDCKTLAAASLLISSILSDFVAVGAGGMVAVYLFIRTWDLRESWIVRGCSVGESDRVFDLFALEKVDRRSSCRFLNRPSKSLGDLAVSACRHLMAVAPQIQAPHGSSRTSEPTDRPTPLQLQLFGLAYCVLFVVGCARQKKKASFLLLLLRWSWV